MVGMLNRLRTDQDGATMFEYVLILGMIVLPLIMLFEKLFEMLSDYFGMIAYYVSWPFL
jgi:Flp pilus assembly pilin Flp